MSPSVDNPHRPSPIPLRVNAWLSAGLDAMTMKMAMGDTMIGAGPSLSAAFLRRFATTVSANAMSSGGMTMWTATTALGVHF